MKLTNTEQHEPDQNSNVSEWPSKELERVTYCPICNSTERETLHTGLTDRVFFCAPGRWTVRRCLGCGSGYLDPRPTPESIHKAYSLYYTHEGSFAKQNFSKLGLIRRSLGNGYRNWRFGTTFKPSNNLGILIFLFWPSIRKKMEQSLRHLPKRRNGGRLLDVGFGAAEFLEQAQKGGWKVTGADPDPVVVQSARSKGLDVRQGGIEAFSSDEEGFDVITMCHVIEHVFDPRKEILGAFKLLKPGGALWIQTPNIDGPMHLYFGRDWRDLDPPRHLTIFRRDALIDILVCTGFIRINDLSHDPDLKQRFLLSRAIRMGESISQDDSLSSKDTATVETLIKNARSNPGSREYITIMCYKPL